MPFESTEATSAIRVERVKNLEASINYNTRQMYVMNDSDFLVAWRTEEPSHYSASAFNVTSVTTDTDSHLYRIVILLSNTQ